MSLKNYCRRFSFEEDKQLLDMRAAGRRASEIAEALSRTVIAIETRVYTLKKKGVDVPDPKPLRIEHLAELKRYAAELKKPKLAAVG